MKTINIAKDFSRYPAGRYIEEGPFSGQQFREEHLLPALSESTNKSIRIEFDGTRGYGSSFLEEAFGGLVRQGHKPSDLLARFDLVSRDPSVVAEVLGYIDSANISKGMKKS